MKEHEFTLVLTVDPNEDDGETYGPFPSGPGLSVADLQVTGQVFRFDVATSTGGNTGAVEIEIYG